MGLTTAGRLFYPPLQIIGLPLLIYMGIPAAKTTYAQLWVRVAARDLGLVGRICVRVLPLE